jgi:ubiquinone/menaquinone biosynthesis C-methylase UbiE
MREVFRVLKPGGTLVLIAEIYRGANTTASKLAEKYASRTGMTLLSVADIANSSQTPVVLMSR